MIYLDLDLSLEPAGQDYRARARSLAAGEVVISVPAPALEISTGDGAPQAIGRKLFSAVFSGELLGHFRQVQDRAEQQGAGVRIRLHLGDTPQLAGLPWEYLYDDSRGRFLSLSTQTPLLRYLELPQSIRPLQVVPPLRVLALMASPPGFDPLDVDAEWATLQEALAKPLEQRQVVLERLPRPTLAALRQQLRSDSYHVLHFLGHGAFDEASQDGIVLLEDQNAGARFVSGQLLSTILHDHRPLRLCLLNSCRGAQASLGDAYAGVAQRLVRQGIPAVVAMQAALSDGGAIAFAREFYAATADGYPVDAAVAEARKALYEEGQEGEFGAPVLFMRAPDGLIFELGGVASEAKMPAQETSSIPSAGSDTTPDGERTVSSPTIVTTASPGMENAVRPLSGYEREIADIREKLKQGRMVLFLGADLPESVTGIPSRQALADGLATRYNVPPGRDLASVAQQIMQAGNRYEFTQYLRDALDGARKSPQRFQRAVAAVIQRCHPETVFTTAYDNLLQKALDEAGVPFELVVRNDNLRFLRADRPGLLKLYGDRDQVDTLVVTEQDQNALLRGLVRADLVDELRRSLRRNGILFVGYDLADHIVSALFDEVTESHFQMASYAVWSGLSEQECSSLKSNRNLTVLDADPVLLMEQLASA